ncbi:caspase-8 [Echeneis naucrates]|uniref:Caspase-8 n=1 Tax=Echeneis naucrates TaxID=173247 RepID=A0A665U117_ECHNA|nr:caspase-8-like [Echeneis naucrates]XP_029380440.1 caspase-8-like [Echeneis naucrates]
MMDRLKLFQIDDELGSSEVAALCFLCIGVVPRKRLEGIKDAKALFLKLEENGLMEDGAFLSQLLNTINRVDLLNRLETDSRGVQETDARPVLSTYRVMLYKIYDDITEKNFDTMKFLLSQNLGRRQIENCNTALDLFSEMEKADLLSNTKLDELQRVLRKFDHKLSETVQDYIDAQQNLTRLHPPVRMDNQRASNICQPMQPLRSESVPGSERQTVYTDATPNRQAESVIEETDYYILRNNPRGRCVIINNEKFDGFGLKNREGTQEDAKALKSVFTRLGFTVMIHNDLTADSIRQKLSELGEQNFFNDDALVICVLSHGEKGCVFGTDENKVLLKELTSPFSSKNAPTLSEKPKLFFIQACQGKSFQEGSMPFPARPGDEEKVKENRLEEDAGPIYCKKVPWDADFLMGMATVPDYKSFRHTSTGSIYIQELCRQLIRAAESPYNDDILSVLTRVNREVSKEEFLTHKQMPEPKYTLTKKLVLKFV